MAPERPGATFAGCMGAPFPRWSNTAVHQTLLVLVVGFAGTLAFLYALARSPYVTNAGDPVQQPVRFDHRHHVRDDGIDCRYCHYTVDTQASAGLPPTELSMNCHSPIWTTSPRLEPVRQSYFTGQPIPWKRVDVLPAYVYFNHAIHVTKSVGCSECHGRVDGMAEVYKTQPMTMQWCLACHRDPAPHLRPHRFITAMDWHRPADPGLQERLMLQNNVQSRTYCSTCHPEGGAGPTRTTSGSARSRRGAASAGSLWRSCWTTRRHRSASPASFPTEPPKAAASPGAASSACSERARPSPG